MDQRKIWNALASPWNLYRKHVWPETQEFLNNHSGLILDLGCGSGRNFIEGRNFVGLDFSEKMLQHAQQRAADRDINVGLVCGDMTRLPFKDDTFDACVCISAIQCIEDADKRKKAVEELNRVMKTGGEALVSVWNRDQPKFSGKTEDYIPG